MIQNVPESITSINTAQKDLILHDFKMTGDVFKSKVNLTMHMFSFLQKGKKQVHFADDTVTLSSEHSILTKKGNCLWSEMLDNDDIYYCKLLFFSDHQLTAFVNKHLSNTGLKPKPLSYFVIENDAYIDAYLQTLTTIEKQLILSPELLAVKFEELMLYLLQKYGESFGGFLASFAIEEPSNFRQNIESNMYEALSIEEIAFLCNMSLSTFKRRFIKEYGMSPGKWLQDKRLQRAKDLIESGQRTPSDIYMELGYNNLSNFSAAFKKKFKINPSTLK